MGDQDSTFFVLYNANDLFEESHSSENEPNAHRVVQSKTEFCVSVNVPGVKSSDLEVSVDGRVLHVTGACRGTTSDGQPREKARFSKSFVIDFQTVDLSQMKASLTDGVLIMTAPRVVKAEPRIIKIVTTDPDPVTP
jgi:HSP20 family molecular chaperone IbpA